ncbi:MAG: DUF3050 domain-containing protein [Gammaproteobacteria bacterium]|nr:DUF3050 domain-containing protein [Gammaproteobacteria bacterium]
MSATPLNPKFNALKQALDQHPIYAEVRTLKQLRCFMQHHVYSVWDFMSLVKYLQQQLAPALVPWQPPRDRELSRFINELVLEEESDQALPDADGRTRYASHFELYLQSMEEIGADTRSVRTFVQQVRERGIATALDSADIPEPARHFCRTTFDLIARDQAHEVAASLALGREHIIPGMFRSLLQRVGVSARQAPGFHYYLERHIHLASDAHGPMSLRLMQTLCDDDIVKQAQAEAVAMAAVQARLEFWHGVRQALPQGQRIRAA